MNSDREKIERLTQMVASLSKDTMLLTKKVGTPAYSYWVYETLERERDAKNMEEDKTDE